MSESFVRREAGRNGSDHSKIAVAVQRNGEVSDVLERSLQRRDGQPRVTFVASLLPYPIDYGGVMATHSLIQAIAAVTSVSVVVLSAHKHNEALIRAAEGYYRSFCHSFAYHQFDDLSPSDSLLVKTWHYATGYPRHGFWKKEADALLLAELRSSGAQVLWCNTTFDAKYLRSAKEAGYATVLSTQNVESDIVRQQGEQTTSSPDWLTSIRSFDVRRLERFGARWADVITGITDVDVGHFRVLKQSGHVFLMPFTYTAPIMASGGEHSEEPNTICFVGSMNWAPNVAAAEHLVRDIMPLVWQKVPDAKCYLVGRNPDEQVSALAGDNVIVTGGVESVQEYYNRAAVVVVPVRDVSGAKIKLVEAMAAGKPIVTSSAGKAGLNAEDGRQLVIADDVGTFASAVVRLLGDKNERQRLGCCAQQFVRDELSPKVAAQQVAKILECLGVH